MAMRSNAVAQEYGAIYFHVECRNELGLGGFSERRGAFALLDYITTPKAFRYLACNEIDLTWFHLVYCDPQQDLLSWPSLYFGDCLQVDSSQMMLPKR